MSVDHYQLSVSWDFEPRNDLDTPSAQRRNQQIARVRQLASLRFAGRIDELMQHFAPDCELYLGGGTRGMPLCGRFRGREEVAARLRAVDVMFERIKIEIVSVIVEKDDVAVRWRCQARDTVADTADWLEGMSVLNFRDGLVAYYGNFLDTAMAMRFIR